MPKVPEQVDLLRNLPFVKAVRHTPSKRAGDQQFDGTLDVRVPTGIFRFLVEEKRSFLTRESVDELIARAHQLRRRGKRFVLFAPYIARPMADRLAGKVDWVDLVGNCSLNLGTYHWTAIGNPTKAEPSEHYPTSPAPIQLLILYLTIPDSLGWSVRRVAEEIDVKHAWVAVARNELQAEGLLKPKGTAGKKQPIRAKKHYEPGDRKKVLARIVDGYRRVLRPRITLGRYRYQEQTPDAFLKRLAAEKEIGAYALTGAPAAKILQRFYTAPDVPIFCQRPPQAVLDRLRLLRDPTGQVTFLRAFGNVVRWKTQDGHCLAPPCLIYAELLYADDPRAEEAAEDIEAELL